MGGGRQGSGGGGHGQRRGGGGRGWRGRSVDAQEPLSTETPTMETTPSVPTGFENELALFRQQLQECREAMAELNQRILELSRAAVGQSVPQEVKLEENAEEARDEKTQD
ncbi:MAG: hypothetical protein ACOYEP_00385 [Limnochordia bacterium]